MKIQELGYIYKITNTVNGKIYVGQTKHSVESRFAGHVRSSIKYNNKTSIPLQNSIRKYGKENFTVEVVEECPLELLNEREKYWIKTFDSLNPNIGYNLCKGGEGGCGGPMFKGHHHSEETKQKMSDNRKGENNSNFGNHWKQSDELKQKHSELSSGKNNGMYGKHHSEDSKTKIGLANSTYWMTNGIEDIKVNPEDVELYILAGYRRGRTFARKKIK